jgi:ParB family chromosome partitioning protein
MEGQRPHRLRLDRYTGPQQPLDRGPKDRRRETIANNKAMDAANTVRRKWIADLLAGTAEPKGSKKFIAQELAESSYLLGTWVNGGRKMLDDLLTPGKPRRHGTKRVPARTSETRYTMIALASVIAAHESDITRTTWRNKNESVARYLQWCMLNGYEPGKVEQLIIDKATGNTATTSSSETAQRPALTAVPDTSTGTPADPDTAPALPETVEHDEQLPIAA